MVTSPTPVLADVLIGGLDIVICGTAAGHASARVAAYYAGPGNQFWSALHVTGLTPRRLRPSEFRDLTRYGIGLTDVCKHASGADSDLRDTDYDVDGFWQRINAHRPALVAFNGKQAAKAALRVPSVSYGPQDRDVAALPVFVLPSTSGAARGHWDLAYWHELARRTRRL